VLLRGDRLIIESPIEIEGWEVRRHRRLLVHYEGRGWTPCRIELTVQGSMRYELAPWNPAPLEIPGGAVEYGSDFVERRDSAAASRRRHERAGLALNLLSPLVGLLGARLKGSIEARFGIDSSAATARAVSLEALAIAPAVALVAIEFVASGIAGQPVGLPWRSCAAVALVLAPDVLMRWDRLLAEEHPPPGFYEWAWRPRRRARNRGGRVE